MSFAKHIVDENTGECTHLVHKLVINRNTAKLTNYYFTEKNFERFVERPALGTAVGHRRKGVQGKYHAKASRQTRIRRKEMLRNAVYNNFSRDNCRFLTLTFDPKKHSATDREVCHRLFRAFIRNLKHYYDGLCYLAVMERQEGSQNWHIHLLINVTDCKQEEFSKLWHCGFMRCETVKNMAELCRYLTKDFHELEEYEHAVLCSRNLNKPITIKEWKCHDGSFDRFIAEHLDGKVPVYRSHSSNDWVGDLTYSQYRLDTPVIEFLPAATRIRDIKG